MPVTTTQEVLLLPIKHKTLFTLGKILAIVIPIVYSYVSSRSNIADHTQRTKSEANASLSEVSETLKKIQSERTAERTALINELATLHAQIELLSRRQKKAVAVSKSTAKTIAVVNPVIAPATVKVSPAEIQQQVKSIQEALPPPPKPPEISASLDEALQRQQQQAQPQ